MGIQCNSYTHSAEHIVLFGASGHSIKVAHIFQSIGLDFDFFVDNDSQKVGGMLEGKFIKSPKELVDSSIEYKIVIASIYHGEIENQLLQLGIKKENIILKERFIIDYINEHLEQFINSDTLNRKQTNINSILFDFEEGLKLGGAVKWSLTLSEELYKNDKNIILLSNANNDYDTYNLKCKVKSLDISLEQYVESVKKIVSEIVSNLPCTVILNRIGLVFMAAYIVKKYYGDKIKIISILHSDFVRIYEHNKLFTDHINAFICVSEDIKKSMIECYGIESNKVFYKASPIKFKSKLHREYSSILNPLVIGYGGRLEKGQKRADLLIPLIQSLEEMNISYYLKIAGDGSYHNKILEYITRNSLEDKVKLYGTIPYEKMPEFWENCDIYVNLSDIEGCCLSMLEAMSYGAVPIVTNTSGTSEFIENGINGFVCNTRDVESIAKKIKDLSISRDKLMELGSLSREKIRSMCNPNDYVNFFNEIINL